MTLQFESLRLQNFGPYRDTGLIDLSVTPASPIVVFHGENTLGKTSIFRALRWGLYGSPDAGVSPSKSAIGLKSYLNRPAVADGESAMEVSISWVANGSRYQLVRSARFEGDMPHVSADLRIDSMVVQEAMIDAEIGRLLHPQISEFFLFDGELLRDFYDRLNSDRERDLLQSSIESVLGIPALQRAADDVHSLHIDSLLRQNKAIKDSKAREDANRKLRELKSKQESIQKDRVEVGKALRKAKEDLERVRGDIAAVDDLKADAREMQTLEAQINGAETEAKALRGEMARLISTGWLAPAARLLSERLVLIRAQNDRAETSRVEIREARDVVAILEEQIRGGSCPTCHQDLPPASEQTQAELVRARDGLLRLESNTGATADIQLERRVLALLDVHTVHSYRERQDRLDRIVSAQFDRNRRLQTIKDRLKGNDAATIRQLGFQQEQFELAISRFEGSLRDLDAEDAEVKSVQSKLAATIGRLTSAQPALAAEAFFFSYVHELFQMTIHRYRERTRAEVERTATDMFHRLIRDPEGYGGVQIGRDYRVDLVGSRGPAMKTSEGGRQLIALSLIGALKLAAVRGGPVVLDSPLARLDMTHRENVLQQWVPALGNQAILLVHNGELTVQQSQSIMGNAIGHAYRIYRPTNDPEVAQIERAE